MEVNMDNAAGRSMSVLLLGTGGGGTPRLGRHGSAWLVTVGKHRLLFDCGPGATQQLVRARIPPRSVGPLFLTHHHFDHFVDYPYFALSSWLSGRDAPLEVYGPTPTKRLTELLFDAGGVFDQDLRARSESESVQRIYVSRHGHQRERMSVQATDIERPGVIRNVEDYTVTAAFTPHTQPFMESVAYRVDAQWGSVVLSGDTRPSPTVLELAMAATVLVHECTRPDAALRALGLDLHHSGPEGVGRLAARAGVGTLVLTHFSIEHDSPTAVEEMVNDARQFYQGEVIAGEDLLEIGIDGPSTEVSR